MFRLGIRRFIEGAEDAHGNPVKEFSDPEPWMVYSIIPGAMTEKQSQSRDPNVIVFTIDAPAVEPLPTELDLVTVDGEDFAVEGHPSDWTRGWNGPGNAGVMVELKRWEG